MNDTIQSPGWDAITEQCRVIYGAQEPKHYGTVIPYRLGGPDPLDGISIYRSGGIRPFWHFVTYGFSELYEKETDDPEVSGFGFELTCRSPIEESEEPPLFVVNVLQNLARYVYNSGNFFSDGDHMDLNGPIRLDSGTKISAICFASDALLKPTTSANGRVEFLQLIGITSDELSAVKSWNTTGVIEQLRKLDPLLLTDLQRASILDQSSVAEEVSRLSKEEGSSTGTLFAGQQAWESPGLFSRKARWKIGAYPLKTILKVLPARILHGNSLSILSESGAVTFKPAEAFRAEYSSEGLTISMPTSLVEDFCSQISLKAGTYSPRDARGLEVVVEQTEITDSAGNVTEVVG